METRPGNIFVVSGASGSGKSSLIRYCLERDPRLVYSISATTRPPRPGEVDGREYFFCSPEEFQRLIREDKLAEYQEVHAHWYGTPVAFLRNHTVAGRFVIMDIDVYGKTKLDRRFPENVGIFIEPPSTQVLEERLRGRSTDREEDIQLRLRNARVEMAYAREPGRYQYYVINDRFEEAARRLLEILTDEMDRPCSKKN